MAQSSQELALPSAIISDLALTVPLFAVSQLGLSATYALPAIGSAAFRTGLGASDDSVSLSALLVGPGRLVWKQQLELLAKLSRGAGVLKRLSGGALNGVVLISKLVTRIDMQFTSLSFSVSAQRRDTIEVSLSLHHVPRPGATDLLIDTAATAAMSMIDPFA